MRLLYIVVDDLQPTAGEVERLSVGGSKAVGEGSTFTVEPIDIGPLHYYENAVGLAMCVPGILLKLIERQNSYDAALLGCWGDPGLRAARTVADIPVIGAAEASVALSALVAQRFGVVTIMSSDIPEIDANLTSLGARDRCVGVSAVELPFYALIDNPSDTLGRLVDGSRPLLERGAEAILLGCMSFGFYPFAEQLQAKLGVPVIDPLRSGVAAAKAMFSLGVRPSPRYIPKLDDPEHLVGWLEGLRAGLNSHTVGAPVR